MIDRTNYCTGCVERQRELDALRADLATALASAQGMRAALERWQAFSRHLFGPCVICWDENAEGLCTEAQELLGLEIHRTAAGSQIQNYATIQEMTNRALTATPPAEPALGEIGEKDARAMVDHAIAGWEARWSKMNGTPRHDLLTRIMAVIAALPPTEATPR